MEPQRGTELLASEPRGSRFHVPGSGFVFGFRFKVRGADVHGSCLSLITSVSGAKTPPPGTENSEPETWNRTPNTNVEHGTRNAELLSAFQREDIVERLPAPDNLEPIVVHEHFRSEEAPVVI